MVYVENKEVVCLEDKRDGLHRLEEMVCVAILFCAFCDFCAFCGALGG